MSALRRLFPRLLLGLFLLVVMLAAALAVLPARWLMRLVPENAPLAIVDAAGTVWSGTALVALGPPGARTTLPNPMQWHLGWQDGLRAQVSHPWLNCTLALRPGLSALRLSPCQIGLPAETLAAIGPPLNTLKPAGNLLVRWPALTLPYRGRLPQGELLTVDWTDAGSALSLVRPLGNYRIQLTGANDATNVSIATLTGVLRIEGQGSYNPRTGVQFAGRAAPAPDTPAATVSSLQALLSAIGRRSGDASIFQIGRPTR